MTALQALSPPQADGTSSRLQAWLQCPQLPWVLQAAGALLGHGEGRSEAGELQVGSASTVCSALPALCDMQ
jgi:hypothetical protein